VGRIKRRGGTQGKKPITNFRNWIREGEEEERWYLNRIRDLTLALWEIVNKEGGTGGAERGTCARRDETEKRLASFSHLEAGEESVNLNSRPISIGGDRGRIISPGEHMLATALERKVAQSQFGE